MTTFKMNIDCWSCVVSFMKIETFAVFLRVSKKCNYFDDEFYWKRLLQRDYDLSIYRKTKINLLSFKQKYKTILECESVVPYVIKKERAQYVKKIEIFFGETLSRVSDFRNLEQLFIKVEKEDFPNQIACLSKLRVLVFVSEQTDNKISISEDFCNLVNLERLEFRCRQLICLPKNFHFLEKLKVLFFHGDRPVEFPLNIDKMKSLESLSFGTRYFSKAPNFIYSLSTLKYLKIKVHKIETWRLKNIKELDLSQHFTEIEDFTSLKKLKTLHIDPMSFSSSLNVPSKLKYLYVRIGIMTSLMMTYEEMPEHVLMAMKRARERKKKKLSVLERWLSEKK